MARLMRFYHLKHFFTDLGFSLRTGRAWYEVKHDLWSQWSALTYPFRAFVGGLHNLWDYLPVIWRDGDWDQSFLLELMEFKMKRMAKLHQERGHLSRRLATAKQLRTAAALCRRLRLDEYGDLTREQHERRWGRMEIDWRTTSDPGLRYSRMSITVPNATSDGLKEQERKEYRVMWEHDDYLRKQDLAYLGKLLAKHCLTWWD